VSNGLQMLGVDIAVVDLLSDRADSAHVVLVPMPPHATVYAPAVARSARSLRRAGWTDDQHSDRPLPATWILQARLFGVSWSKTAPRLQPPIRDPVGRATAEHDLVLFRLLLDLRSRLTLAATGAA